MILCTWVLALTYASTAYVSGPSSSITHFEPFWISGVEVSPC